MRTVYWLLTALLTLTVAAPSRGASFDPGRVLFVAGETAGGFDLGDIVVLDPETGATELAASGWQEGSFTTERAVYHRGSILAFASWATTLFRIDPNTGQRTPFSSVGDGNGDDFSRLLSLKVGPSGDIWAYAGPISIVSGQPPQSSLVRIDPETGHRETVSGYRFEGSGSTTLVGAGPDLQRIVSDFDFALDGSVLLPNSLTDTIMRIDATTGDRTIVSSSDPLLGPVGSGPLLELPRGLAVDLQSVPDRSHFR